MKVTIGDPIEQVTYPTPKKRLVCVVIPYTTEKGFEGTVVLEKAAATPAGIAAAIKADVEHLEKSIGTKIEI